MPRACRRLTAARSSPTTSPPRTKAGGDAARAGAIVVGKTNTPEWGAGANTRNAFMARPATRSIPTVRGRLVRRIGGGARHRHGAAGDRLGHRRLVRNPAAFCGVVGFRPTPGLIASDSRNMAWLQISALGPMARTVPDPCLMLSA